MSQICKEASESTSTTKEPEAGLESVTTETLETSIEDSDAEFVKLGFTSHEAWLYDQNIGLMIDQLMYQMLSN